MIKATALVLDSTVYKQIPKLNSQLFTELIRHCRLGKFQLFIPEMIEQEYLTWIEREIKETVATISRSSESLTRFSEPAGISWFSINNDATTYFATSNANKVLREAYSRWERFKKEIDARVVPIDESHGKLVMTSYFTGQKPFKSLKNRNDIPDAFIYFSLADIAEAESRLVFVTADKGFLSRMEDSRIRTFENLSDLFSNTDFQIDASFFTSLDSTDKWFRLFQYFKDEIFRKAKQTVNRAELLYDVEKDYWDDIIGEFRETYSDVLSVDIKPADARMLQVDSYLVPFSAVVEVKVSSLATPEEFKRLEGRRKKALENSEINDDGKYEVREFHSHSVKGNISVSFSSTDPLSWKPKLDKDSFFGEEGIEEISLKLEDIERST